MVRVRVQSYAPTIKEVGAAGPISDRAVIAAFEQSDVAKKNRAASAVFSQVLTAPPKGMLIGPCSRYSSNAFKIYLRSIS